MDTRILKQGLDQITTEEAPVEFLERMFYAYAREKLHFLLDQLSEYSPDAMTDETAEEAEAAKQAYILAKEKEIAGFLRELAGFYKLLPHLHYNFQPRNYINQACFLMATWLELILGVNRYQLLMPDLTMLSSEVTFLDLTSVHLPMHHFIQSGDRFIEVLPCLQGALLDPINYGVLKHTTLFDGHLRPLSDAETVLVINHSEYTEAYWNAIQHKLSLERQGLSFGAALTRLADGLLEGTARKLGFHAEYDSGQNANVAIMQFSEWLTTLTPQEHDMLMALERPVFEWPDDGYEMIVGLGSKPVKTFAEIWGRLARPNDADYKKTIYCVDTLQTAIRDILKNNKHLFNLYPAAARTGASDALCQDEFAEAEQVVKVCEEALTSALSSPDYPVRFPYQVRAEDNEAFIIQFFTLPDLQQHLTQYYCRELFFNHPDLFAKIHHILSTTENDAVFNAWMEKEYGLHLKSFTGKDTDHLSENKHKRFVPSSRLVGHALIWQDRDGTKRAQQFYIPRGTDPETPAFVQLKEIQEIKRAGRTVFRALTLDNIPMFASRFVDGEFNGNPVQIAFFSPRPGGKAEPFWGSSESEIPMFSSVGFSDALKEWPLFRKATDLTHEMPMSSRAGFSDASISVVTTNEAHTKGGRELVVDPVSVRAKLGKQGFPDQNTVMGMSAKEAYNEFYQDWSEGLSPDMQNILKRAIDASLFDLRQSQFRPEWLHAEAFSLTPLHTDSQRRDNLGAAGKWVNVEMMLLEHVVKWFALNRPQALEKIKPHFEMLLDTELIKKVNFEVSIEEQGHIFRLLQTINPFKKWPLFRKATDLTQTTAVVLGLLEQAPPLVSCSIFAEQTLKRARSEEKSEEKEVKEEKKIEDGEERPASRPRLE